MKRAKKGLAFALALIVTLGTFAGCADDTSTANTDVTQYAESSAERERNVGKERVKLTMVMSSSGLTPPEGTDYSTNEWAKTLADMANVELEIDQPEYSSYDQKLQLRLSSNDLPDIVHCIGGSLTTGKEAALDGAFVNLNDYYANSVNVKNVISENQMAWCESADGNNYYIPMNYTGAPLGSWIMARWDMVEKYNDGKWPTTVPEWTALLQEIHQAEPDLLLLSNQLNKTGYSLGYGGRAIYKMYGLSAPAGGEEIWDYDEQKAVNEFLTPEYKAATDLMRQLYEEGILDPEFGTTEKWADNKKTKGVIMEGNNSTQVTFKRLNYPDYPEAKEHEWRYAAPFTEFPEEVRWPETAYGTRSSGISSHGVFIAASCKNPDRAWDVLEALSSTEFRDFCVWGKEGVNYEVKDGEKVPIVGPTLLSSNDPDVFRWQRQYLIIWGFPEYREYDIAAAKLEDEEFTNEQVASYEPIDEYAGKVGNSPIYLPYTMSDDASRKKAESQASMSTITINYIMGKISEADFEAERQKWEEEYGFIAEEHTKAINDYDRAQAEAMDVQFTLD